MCAETTIIILNKHGIKGIKMNGTRRNNRSGLKLLDCNGRWFGNGDYLIIYHTYAKDEFVVGKVVSEPKLSKIFSNRYEFSYQHIINKKDPTFQERTFSGAWYEHNKKDMYEKIEKSDVIARLI